LTIVDVARVEAKGQQFPPIFDRQVPLKAIKLAPGGLPASGDLFEHVVAVDPTVVTNHQGGRVDEGHAGVGPVAGQKSSTSQNTVSKSIMAAPGVQDGILKP
jgi:hypothetical protein